MQITVGFDGAKIVSLPARTDSSVVVVGALGEAEFLSLTFAAVVGGRLTALGEATRARVSEDVADYAFALPEGFLDSEGCVISYVAHCGEGVRRVVFRGLISFDPPPALVSDSFALRLAKCYELERAGIEVEKGYVAFSVDEAGDVWLGQENNETVSWENLSSALNNSLTLDDIATKADRTELLSLAADLAEKADRAEVVLLAADIDGKADGAEVASLAAEIEGKADEAEVLALSGALASFASALGTKVSLSYLNERLGEKAEATEFAELATEVAELATEVGKLPSLGELTNAFAGKVGHGELNLLLDEKADKAEVAVLATEVGALADEVGGFGASLAQKAERGVVLYDASSSDVMLNGGRPGGIGSGEMIGADLAGWGRVALEWRCGQVRQRVEIPLEKGEITKGSGVLVATNGSLVIAQFTLSPSSVAVVFDNGAALLTKCEGVC